MSRMTLPEALEIVKIRLAHVEADDELIVAWHMVEASVLRSTLLSRVREWLIDRATKPR